MITLELHAGYWTVCIDSRALCSFDSLEIALERVPEATVVFDLQAAA